MPDVEWGSKGAEKVLRDNEGLTKSVEKTGTAYKDTMRSAQELGRIAARIAKDNETAQEKYNRQLTNAKKAMDAGLISEQQLVREKVRLTIELARATDGTNKYRTAVDGATASQSVATGSRAIAGVQALGKAWTVASAGVLAAVAAMRQASQEMAAIGEKASAAMTGGAEGLAIEAGGDPVKMKHMLGEARKTYSEGAFSDPRGAYKLQAELEQAGLQKDRPFFSRYQEVGDSAAAVKAVGLVRNVFSEKEAGNASQILSKAFAVAKDAPGVEPEQVLEAVAKTGITAKPLGVTDEVVFATIQQYAEKTGDAPRASKLATSTFKGLGDVRGQSPAEVVNRIDPSGELFKRLRNIDAAQSRDDASQFVDTFIAQPAVRSGRYSRAMEAMGTAKVDDGGKGGRSQRLAAIRELEKKSLRNFWPGIIAEPLVGLSGIGRALTPDAIEESLIRPEFRQESIAPSQQDRPPAGAESSAVLQGIRDELQRQTKIMDSQRRQAPVPTGRRE